MKPIRIESTFACPVAHVWSLFTDVERMPEWCQGFVSLETIEGEPESVGSVHLLTFQEGKQTIVMRETVTAFEPERRFAFVAEAPGMRTESETQFVAEGEGTRVIADNVFLPGNFLMRLMMPLAKGSIAKRIAADFARLRVLAEESWAARSTGDASR